MVRKYDAMAPADVARLYAEMLKPGSAPPPLDDVTEALDEFEVTVMTTAEALDAFADLM